MFNIDLDKFLILEEGCINGSFHYDKECSDGVIRVIIRVIA